MESNIHVLEKNIYITDNSEIRDWWVLNTQTNKVYFVKGFYGVQPHVKKIIITNDIDLILGGIQSISDEFLQWFVKNTSCESVKIVDDVECLPMPNIHIHKHIYKIIVPKETPKKM